MAWIIRQWGILSATALAVLMIAGSYVVASGGLAPQKVDAASTTSLLKSIANRDSDGDGLPDWEEALYGTNPHKVDTFGLGMTDGEAVAKGLIVPKAFAPSATSTTASLATSTSLAAGSATSTEASSTPAQDSLTSLFTQRLFAAYVSAKQANNGQPLSKQQISALGQKVMQQVSPQIINTPDYRTQSQVKVSGSGADALRAYAATVQQSFAAHTVSEDRGMLTYVQEAAQGDASAIPHIQAISNLYQNAAASLAQIAAPKEAAHAHYELINAYARMANVTNDLAKVNSDPIVSMLALSVYNKAVFNLAQAFVDMHNVFKKAGITFAPTDPGYELVNVATSTPNIAP